MSANIDINVIDQEVTKATEHLIQGSTDEDNVENREWITFYNRPSEDPVTLKKNETTADYRHYYATDSYKSYYDVTRRLFPIPALGNRTPDADPLGSFVDVANITQGPKVIYGLEIPKKTDIQESVALATGKVISRIAGALIASNIRANLLDSSEDTPAQQKQIIISFEELRIVAAEIINNSTAQAETSLAEAEASENINNLAKRILTSATTIANTALNKTEKMITLNVYNSPYKTLSDISDIEIPHETSKPDSTYCNDAKYQAQLFLNNPGMSTGHDYDVSPLSSQSNMKRFFASLPQRETKTNTATLISAIATLLKKTTDNITTHEGTFEIVGFHKFADILIEKCKDSTISIAELVGHLEALLNEFKNKTEELHKEKLKALFDGTLETLGTGSRDKARISKFRSYSNIDEETAPKLQIDLLNQIYTTQNTDDKPFSSYTGNCHGINAAFFILMLEFYANPERTPTTLIEKLEGTPGVADALDLPPNTGAGAPAVPAAVPAATDSEGEDEAKAAATDGNSDGKIHVGAAAGSSKVPSARTTGPARRQAWVAPLAAVDRNPTGAEPEAPEAAPAALALTTGNVSIVASQLEGVANPGDDDSPEDRRSTPATAFGKFASEVHDCGSSDEESVDGTGYGSD